jgi:hypothetical protein
MKSRSSSYHCILHVHSLSSPDIATPSAYIYLYLPSIHKYVSCSKECFILALIYINQLIKHNNFLLTELKVQRIIIISVLLAVMIFDTM